MVAKSNEKIKEELCSAILHLELHSAASLEGAATANDQSKIVCTEFRVGIGSIGVCVTG